MVNEWFDSFIPDLAREIDTHSELLSYPSNQSSFSKEKVRMYEDNIFDYLVNDSYIDPIGSFMMFVKSGESYFSSDELVYDAAGYLDKQSSRPRAIMGPANQGFGIM